MIQADKNYVYGSTAEKIKYDVYEENEVLKAKKRQRTNNKMKVKLVLLLMVVFSAGLMVMYRYAVITQMNYKINSTYKKYNDIKNNNIKLKAEIERDLDLQKVREIAETKLGMQKPDKYQIVYVKIPKDDFTEVSEIYKNRKIVSESFLTRLKDKVGMVVSFLY